MENAKNTNNRIAIRFVITLFVFYILFSQGNLFMNAVVSKGGNYYSPFVDHYLNYVQGLRYALIIPASWIVQLFGYHTIHNEMDLLVVNGPILRVHYDCLGLGVMSFLAAFIIAFPAPVKPKFKMLIIGFLTIYLLNIIRIAGLALLVASFRSQRSYFEYHHEIFNVCVYVIIFFMLYVWIKKTSNTLPKAKN